MSTTISPRRGASRAWHRIAPLLHGRWLSPVLLLLLWEAGSRSGLIPERTLAAPSAVLGALGGLIASGELASNLLVSFGRATWPHLLARAMLAEQLFRATSILANHPYHREG